MKRRFQLVRYDRGLRIRVSEHRTQFGALLARQIAKNEHAVPGRMWLVERVK